MPRPWFKFYPADWQGDQMLGRCSLAARGLWMEMLAIMHQADPYGHLLVGGEPLTAIDLARVARCAPDEIPRLLDELRRANVFSLTSSSVIYSRRMIRDAERSADGRRAAAAFLANRSQTSPFVTGKRPGSRRWHAAEKKGENGTTLGVVRGVVRGVVSIPPRAPPLGWQQTPSENNGVMVVAAAETDGLSRARTRARLLGKDSQQRRDSDQTPESEPTLFSTTPLLGTSTFKSPPPPFVRTNVEFPPYEVARIDAIFTEWWKEYPHKVGKRAAKTAYRNALARASPGDLLLGLRRYLNTKPADYPWCHPTTWLHQDRWLDEPVYVAPRLSPHDQIYAAAMEAAAIWDERDRLAEETKGKRDERKPGNGRLGGAPNGALLGG